MANANLESIDAILSSIEKRVTSLRSECWSVAIALTGTNQQVQGAGSPETKSPSILDRLRVIRETLQDVSQIVARSRVAINGESQAVAKPEQLQPWNG